MCLASYNTDTVQIYLFFPSDCRDCKVVCSELRNTHRMMFHLFSPGTTHRHWNITFSAAVVTHCTRWASQYSLSPPPPLPSFLSYVPSSHPPEGKHCQRRQRKCHLRLSSAATAPPASSSVLCSSRCAIGLMRSLPPTQNRKERFLPRCFCGCVSGVM